MKKAIALVALGVLFLISGLGDMETFAGAVIVAAICFFFAYRSYKKAKHSQQVMQETQEAVQRLDADTLTPIAYDDLALKEGEEVYLAVPAKTYTSKEKITRYEGGHSGVSVRVAKGVTLRTGSQKAKPVRETVNTYHSGDYVVTNKRIVFAGTEDSFDIPLENVTAVKKDAADAIAVITGSTVKRLKMNSSSAMYAHALTNTVLKKFAK